jgi:hypothetical protein
LENLFLSILANIISLLIEYGIIKPNFDTAWRPFLSQSGSRDWSTAIKKAIQKLGTTQGGHMLPFGEHYQVEDAHIEKGQGTLTLVVLPKSALLFAFVGLSAFLDALNLDEFPNVIARYQIIIDRSGDILGVKSLPVAENERYRPLYSRQSRFSRFTALPQSELGLKIKKPIKKVDWEGLKIRIEFIVENWGKAKTIYPYVEYKVAELINGKFEERIVHSPSGWRVDLQSFSSKPISFEAPFSAGTQLLAKGKNSVRVRIYPKPWKIPIKRNTPTQH